mgnify:CR=1 FL=1
MDSDALVILRGLLEIEKWGSDGFQVRKGEVLFIVYAIMGEGEMGNGE